MGKQQTVDLIEFNCPTTQRAEQLEITATYLEPLISHRYDTGGQPLGPPKKLNELVTRCSGADHCKLPLPSNQCQYFKAV